MSRIDTLKAFAKDWGPVVVLLGIAVAAGAMRERVSTLETNLHSTAAALEKEDTELKGVNKEQDKELDQADAEIHSHDKRLQREEDRSAEILKLLTRIEAKVDVVIAPPKAPR